MSRLQIEKCRLQIEKTKSYGPGTKLEPSVPTGDPISVPLATYG